MAKYDERRMVQVAHKMMAQCPNGKLTEIYTDVHGVSSVGVRTADDTVGKIVACGTYQEVNRFAQIFSLLKVSKDREED